MEYQQDRAWLEVDLGAIGANYANIRGNLTSGCQVMAVLKANAYGFGAVEVARELERLGCPIFAVVTLEEAMELREAGIKAPVLVMGPINPVHAELAIAHRIEVGVVSLGQATTLSEAAHATGKRIRCHIKVDTGLSRLGIPVKDREDQALQEVLAIARLDGLEAVALFTHFTASEMPGGREFNRLQRSLFARIASRLDASGVPLRKHCSSTLPAVAHPEHNYDYVRVAALVLGLTPHAYGRLDIQFAVELKTRIWQIKQVPAGTAVSYGPQFHTLRDSRLAVVPIGFADGLRRSIANRGCMVIRRKRAPIVGKLSSDYTILDVTDIPDAEEGDVVTVFGRDGVSLTVSEYADLYPGTVAEVTGVLGPRVPRYYLKDGRVVAKR